MAGNPSNEDGLTLGEALPREMARVHDEVLPLYLELRGKPNALVEPQIMMMRADLDAAAKALAEGDVIEMLRVYRSLKETPGMTIESISNISCETSVTRWLLSELADLRERLRDTIGNDYARVVEDIERRLNAEALSAPAPVEEVRKEFERFEGPHTDLARDGDRYLRTGVHDRWHAFRAGFDRGLMRERPAEAPPSEYTELREKAIAGDDAAVRELGLYVLSQLFTLPSRDRCDP